MVKKTDDFSTYGFLDTSFSSLFKSITDFAWFLTVLFFCINNLLTIECVKKLLSPSSNSIIISDTFLSEFLFEEKLYKKPRLTINNRNKRYFKIRLNFISQSF